MKYFSEKLNRLFDSVDECAKAESAHEEALRKQEETKKKLADERAARAKEVEEALQAFYEARKVYTEKLKAFTEDYGAWHYSFTGKELPDLFDFWI